MDFSRQGQHDPSDQQAQPVQSEQHTLQSQRAAFERWRLHIIEQVYHAGIQVFPNAELSRNVPSVPVMDVIFVVCPMNIPAEVDLAFAVLLRKVRAVLTQQQAERGALLVDIAGMVPGTDVRAVWGQHLKDFLQQTCVERHAGQGDFLIARYHSHTEEAGSPKTIVEHMQHIRIMTEAVRQQMASNVLSSREEAIALLRVLLRDQARQSGQRGPSTPSMPAAPDAIPSPAAHPRRGGSF